MFNKSEVIFPFQSYNLLYVLRIHLRIQRDGGGTPPGKSQVPIDFLRVPGITPPPTSGFAGRGNFIRGHNKLMGFLLGQVKRKSALSKSEQQKLQIRAV